MPQGGTSAKAPEILCSFICFCLVKRGGEFQDQGTCQTLRLPGGCLCQLPGPGQEGFGHVCTLAWMENRPPTSMFNLEALSRGCPRRPRPSERAQRAGCSQDPGRVDAIHSACPPPTALWARRSCLPSAAAPALTTRAGPLGLVLAPWAQKADEDRRRGAGRGSRCPAAWMRSARSPGRLACPAFRVGMSPRPRVPGRRGRPCLPRSFYDAL